MKKSIYEFGAAKDLFSALKTYSVDAEKKAFTDQSAGDAANKTLLFRNTGLTLRNNVKIKRTYFAGGSVFVYCSDKAVYGCGDLSSASAATPVKVSDKVFSEEPLVIPITESGAGATIITGKEGAVIVKRDSSDGAFTSEAVDVPNGTCFAVCAGRLFIANGRDLFFSESYDCTNFSTGVESEGKIIADGDCGEIIALHAVCDELYVLAKRRILVLSPKGDIAEWSLKRASAQGFSAHAGFAAGCGKYLVFLSDNRLYKYDASGLKVAKSKLNDRFVYLSERAGSFNGAFVLPLFYGEDDRTYVYDPETDEEFLLPKFYAVSRTGGLATDSTRKTIYNLTAGITTDGEGGSQSEIGGSPSAIDRLGTNYDFGSLARKNLVKIAVKASGAGTIKISGDSATKSFSLASGYNDIAVGVVSRKYRLSFSADDSDFEPLSITFTYAEL